MEKFKTALYVLLTLISLVCMVSSWIQVLK